MTMHDVAVWFPSIRAHSGADVFTERLCAALNARGIRAAITWLPLRAEYAPWSVPVPQPPAWATVAHVNSWLPQRFWPKRLPVVCTLHSCVHDPALTPFKRPLQQLYHRFWICRLEKAALSRAQAVTAVSHYTAHAAAAALGDTQVMVIPNGVDVDFFTPVERDRPHTPFRLLYVGNWIARKGVDLLAPILSALGADFALYYTADRHGRHARYPMPANAYCLGRLDATGLRQAYQNADALLFPSRLEGLPLTVIEAMACGLPVIAARSSSLPEVVEDGESGILCPVDAVDRFVAAARLLASEVALWRRMRQLARARALAEFAGTTQVDRYVRVYTDLTDSRQRF